MMLLVSPLSLNSKHDLKHFTIVQVSVVTFNLNAFMLFFHGLFLFCFFFLSPLFYVPL